MSDFTVSDVGSSEYRYDEKENIKIDVNLEEIWWIPLLTLPVFGIIIDSSFMYIKQNRFIEYILTEFG